MPLDPGFPAVAEALGDADALTEVPQEALMAVAYPLVVRGSAFKI